MCDGAVQDKTSHCEAFKFCHLEKPLLTVCVCAFEWKKCDLLVF